ncbi:glycosyltransferase family 39 protein [Atractiella rhizophila]|nr:glycosyltransferase family 39 protein [Atractiella rhizophila]
MDSILKAGVLGWGLHYFPFFIMQRQLFLHHYLPALWFAILTFAVLFDAVTTYLKPKLRLQIAAVLIIIMLWNWQHYSALAYAGQWTKKKCESARWVKTWDFSCGDFPANVKHFLYLEDYAIVKAASPTPKTITNLKDPLGEQEEEAEPTVQPNVEPIRNVFEAEPEHPKSENVRLPPQEEVQHPPVEETLREGSSKEEDDADEDDEDHALPAQPEPTLKERRGNEGEAVKGVESAEQAHLEEDPRAFEEEVD